MKKRVAILGSTGSIGTQALDVIRQHVDSFQVEALTAHSNADLLISQSIEFQPNAVVIVDAAQYHKVKEALSSYDIKIFAGEKSLEEIVEMSTIDMVLTAMVGFSGLKPTLNAIKYKKEIALANKETLVVAGNIISKKAVENKVRVIPVDSEHSAIFQCLVGEYSPIEKIYLTASGGPFRGKTRTYLEKVTLDEALKHPNWSMGPKITIDSATLMNKGLEVIEAKWLFDIRAEQIEVIVHPQSIIHSMVQFCDGSLKAQMGLPDMRLPIQYAFSYPERHISGFPRIRFSDYSQLTFEEPDLQTFRCLSLAYEVLNKGGNWACSMNAANEIAVEAFIQGEITFLQIPELIESTIHETCFIEDPALEDYLETDREARKITREKINKITARSVIYTQ